MKRYFLLFFVFLLLLTGCDEDKNLKEPSEIKYDGTYITWKAVKNADGYEVVINEGGAKTVTTNKYSYKANGQSFTVKLKAVSNSEKINDSGSVIKEFTYLGKVDHLKIENGILSWDLLDEANSYIVKINNNIEKRVSVNEFTGLPEDTNSVQVRAEVEGDDSYFSDWSDVFQYTMLKAPTNIKYNSEVITWSPVTKASGYIISINGEDFETNKTEFAYAAEGKSTFTLKIRSKGNEASSIYDSKYSEEIEYIFLEPIKSIEVNDGVVSWSSIEHATGYIVELTTPTGTKREEVKTNSYDKIMPDMQYKVRVFAKVEGKNYFSSWSHPFNLRVLPAPVVKYENGNFIWNGVDGANGYYVSVLKGNVPITDQSLTADGSLGFTYTFTTPGEYTVIVKSLSNSSNSGVYDSKYSDAFKVVKLNAPTNISFIHDKNSNNPAYVNFDKVTGAQNYSLVIDNKVVGLPTTSTIIAIDETKEVTLNQKSWNIAIIAHGKVDNSKREVILDSEPSQAKTITKLAVPINLKIASGVFSWNQVAGNEGYAIDIDGNFNENTKDDVDYHITNVVASSHKIKVRALGNGSNIISSDYSAALDFVKLPAPVLTVNNGKITWNKVNNSSGYAYSINNGTVTISKEALEYQITDSDYNVNNSVVFNVYAKGNDSDILDSDPSVTGTIVRLAAPKIRITNSNVTWENISGATEYDVYIGNEVFRNSISGTSFSTTELPAGTYEFTVIARGNPATTVQSKPSNLVRATKLETPVLRLDQHVYKWDSIQNASHYEITILGSTYKVLTTEFDPYKVFTSARTYGVEIKAVNDGENYIDSEVYRIEQEVKNIEVPYYTLSEANRIFTITLTNPNPLAKAFKYYVNGNETVSDESSFTYETRTAGKYTFEVALAGGTFLEGIYYRDSNKTTAKEITIYGAPTELKINRTNLTTKEYTLSWNGVAGARYHYILTDGNDNPIIENTITTTSVSGIDLTGYTTVILKVQALGNNSTTFDSDYNEVFFSLN